MQILQKLKMELSNQEYFSEHTTIGYINCYICKAS